MEVSLYAETVIELTAKAGRRDVEEIEMADAHDVLVEEISSLVKAFAKKHKLHWEVK